MSIQLVSDRFGRDGYHIAQWGTVLSFKILIGGVIMMSDIL